MKKCKTCNSEFSPKDKRKQYCSEKCKWRFENNKSLKKTLEKRKNIVVNDLADEYWKDVVGYEGIYMTERKTHWSFSPMGCKRLTLIENILTNSFW